VPSNGDEIEACRLEALEGYGDLGSCSERGEVLLVRFDGDSN
jgi:hypothetical protein